MVLDDDMKKYLEDAVNMIVSQVVEKVERLRLNLTPI